MEKTILVVLVALATALYFWAMERDSYRASWRIHTAGIALPVVLMTVSRDPVVWAIATSFATVHVASIASEAA